MILPNPNFNYILQLDFLRSFLNFRRAGHAQPSECITAPRINIAANCYYIIVAFGVYSVDLLVEFAQYRVGNDET
jgi:hypothetical protein